MKLQTYKRVARLQMVVWRSILSQQDLITAGISPSLSSNKENVPISVTLKCYSKKKTKKYCYEPLFFTSLTLECVCVFLNNYLCALVSYLYVCLSNPWNRCCRKLWGAMCMLGIEPGSSVGAAGAFNLLACHARHRNLFTKDSFNPNLCIIWTKR